MLDFNNSDDYFYRMCVRGVKKILPEIEDKDIEVSFREELCHQCGKNNVQEIIYRIKGDTEWKKVINNNKLICRDCENTNLLGNTNVEEYRKAAIANKYWFIPDDLKEAGFKTYDVVDKKTEIAKKTCIDYVRHFREKSKEQRVNLFLMGTPGTGKSHLSATIARTLKIDGYMVGFITTGELLTKIGSTYNKNSSITAERILDDIKQFDLLVLDDLGAESHNLDKEFSWSKRILFDIVNARIKKPTIYSTNLNETGLKKAVGDPVYSRLQNNTHFIDLYTEDYRKRLRVEQLEL